MMSAEATIIPKLIACVVESVDAHRESSKKERKEKGKREKGVRGEEHEIRSFLEG